MLSILIEANIVMDFGIWWIIKALLLLNFSGVSSKLTLSPSELQSVICEVGASDSVEVTCNTTEGALRWYVTIPRMFTESRFMSRNSETPVATPLMVNSSTINFTRLSARGALPLVAAVRIDHVNEAVNGTVINCTEGGLNLINPDSSTTTVQIVDQQQYMNGYLHPLNVVTVNASEQFGPEAVTLVLKWTSNSTHSSHISHFVSGIDQHEIRVLDNHSNSVQLSIPYNAVFNITITRILTPCNQTLSSASILLSYFSCRYPSLMQGVQCSVDDYSERLLNGTILTFTCPSGQILNGHNATMCIENGEWKPDPSVVKCLVDCGTPLPPKDAYITSCSAGTTEGANLSVVCLSQPSYPMATIVCNHEGYWEPNLTELCTSTPPTAASKDATKKTLIIVAIISSLAAFVTGSLLFFTVGCVCGRCSYGTSQDNTLYTTSKHVQGDEQVELNQNVAYGSVG